MPGLPHFKNSIAAINFYEPLYVNLFEVTFNPPAALGNKFDSTLMMQQVLSVKGMPEITPVGFVEQWYKSSKRTYAKSKPDDTTATLTMEFEVNLDNANNSYVYNALREWSDLIFNPQDGSMTLKTNYVSSSLIVKQFNKAQQVYRYFKFHSVYLLDPFNPMDLDYKADTIYTMTAKFKCDYWEDLRNGTANYPVPSV